MACLLTQTHTEIENYDFRVFLDECKDSEKQINKKEAKKKTVTLTPSRIHVILRHVVHHHVGIIIHHHIVVVIHVVHVVPAVE